MLYCLKGVPLSHKINILSCVDHNSFELDSPKLTYPHNLQFVVIKFTDCTDHSNILLASTLNQMSCIVFILMNQIIREFLEYLMISYCFSFSPFRVWHFLHLGTGSFTTPPGVSTISDKLSTRGHHLDSTVDHEVAEPSVTI